MIASKLPEGWIVHQPVLHRHYWLIEMNWGARRKQLFDRVIDSERETIYWISPVLEFVWCSLILWYSMIRNERLFVLIGQRPYKRNNTNEFWKLTQPSHSSIIIQCEGYKVSLHPRRRANNQNTSTSLWSELDCRESNQLKFWHSKGSLWSSSRQTTTLVEECDHSPSKDCQKQPKSTGFRKPRNFNQRFWSMERLGYRRSIPLRWGG